MKMLNVKRVRQGVERQLIETRTGLEGLVGKILTQQALQRLRAIHTLLSGLSSSVCNVASCKAVLASAHMTVYRVLLKQVFSTCHTSSEVSCCLVASPICWAAASNSSGQHRVLWPRKASLDVFVHAAMWPCMCLAQHAVQTA